MMPISTRSGRTGGDEGNQVAMAAVPLATDIADPHRRLLAVRRATRRGKSISAILGKDLPARLIEVLPAMVVEHVARFVLVPLVNVTISNVHGPDEALYMAGAKLQMFTPISIAIDGVGLNLTGLSYNGTLWVCFVSCRKMLPDPGVFVKCLTESFNELLAATVGKPEPQAETRPAARRTTVTSRSVRSKAVPVDNKNDAMVTTTVELPVARKQVSRGPRWMT